MKKIVVGDDPLHVNDILSEGRAPFHQATSKDPLSIPKATIFVVPLRTTPLKDVRKARTCFRFFNRQYSIVQAMGSGRMARKGEHLEQGGKTLLGGSSPRGTLREPLGNWLTLPVQAGANMCPPLVYF